MSHNRRELLDLLPLKEEEIAGTRPLQAWIALIDLCQERAQISFLSPSQRNSLLNLQRIESNQGVLFTFDDFFGILKHVTRDEEEEDEDENDNNNGTGNHDNDPDDMNMHDEDRLNKDTLHTPFLPSSLETANHKKPTLLPSSNHFLDLDSRPRSSMPLSAAPSKPRKRRPEAVEEDPDADDRMSGSDGHPSISSFSSVSMSSLEVLMRVIRSTDFFCCLLLKHCASEPR